MTQFEWTVVINKIPYGERAEKPETAVSRALQKYRKEHPNASMVFTDIYLINRSLCDKGKAISDLFNKNKKELLSEGET